MSADATEDAIAEAERRRPPHLLAAGSESCLAPCVHDAANLDGADLARHARAHIDSLLAASRRR